MRATGMGTLCGAAALSLVLFGHAEAQESMTPVAPARAAADTAGMAPGLLVGPATVAPHWSKYRYPESIPEGASYYIVVRGDTLWDISKRFLGNPYLWPQIWDKNRYVTDAHWIYPGDPLIMPVVAMVSDTSGSGLGVGTDEPSDFGPAPAGAPADVLYPAIDETALQCAQYVVDGREDESLRIIGSEQGATKLAFGDRDILYLSKGSNSGVKAGDLYTIHHASYKVKHPETNRTIGTKVETLGWLRVILVQENTATAFVEQACQDIHAGDYLRTFERVSVPLILRQPPPDRLTPPTGKTTGTIVDMGEDHMISGQGGIITVNLGTANGVAPGNVFTVYKVMYPSVPTPRNVIGEIALVAVRERTSTAKVIYSNDALMNGDKVELR